MLHTVGIFCPQGAVGLSLVSRKCMSLKGSQTLPFCRSMSFLTTFKVYCARRTMSQETETKKVIAHLYHSGGYQIPGDTWTFYLGRLINNQKTTL